MGSVTVRPVTPAALVEGVVATVLAVGASGASGASGGRLRVVVDGDPSTRPDALADALVAPLEAAGRAVVRVAAALFWRPASQRFEHGREDVTALRDLWLDERALRREVLDPFGPGGTGEYLPSLRDPRTDRSTRSVRRPTPAGTVLVVDGSLLLGRALPFDVAIHLSTRPGTRSRVARDAPDVLPPWTLPAYVAYADEVDPERVAGVAVRYDDHRHPAVVERADA
ncbi:hypothetical protein CLV34_2652 [Luteimicrobium subarcticum]|uniref:Uridine kinase n=1 Tax=Luteimicrobium subarcticum TaxID=620910 RepID=A0A2M8W725_9MICO|nr:hypothetical protein CLV34_2652 [Luteimicrobium subarcticum]